MTTIKDIMDYFESFAPLDTAAGFDNAGLLAGSPDTEVTRVLLALDITSEVVTEAAEMGAELIISHHPVIFDPLKSLDSSSVVYKLAQNGLSALCMHTNLDVAEDGGVNRCLSEALKLQNVCYIPGEFVVTGTLTEPVTAGEFAAFVRDALGCEKVCCSLCDKMVQKIAICSGAGGGEFRVAIAAGADIFVTGEGSHHDFITAKEKGLAMMTAGHFNTEDIVLPPLAKRLNDRFADVDFGKSKVNRNIVSFI